MTKYNVSPLVAREIEFSTGTIFGGSWCRYFISITLHQCYIEATWKTRPKNDLDGHKEIFNSLQEYLDWFANLKKTYGRRISRKQMVYAAYDETTRTFSYKLREFRNTHLGSLNYCIFKILFLYLHKRKINIIINRP